MKYRPYPRLSSEIREWPTKSPKVAPRWCSVDLRDGNQALAQPMSFEERLALYNLILNIGFKDIEVSFPSSSNLDFQFTRHLIEQNLIPEDVRIQAIMPGRKELIDKTFDALDGAHNAIIHLYYSTSKLHRNIVFRKSKSELRSAIFDTVKYIKQQSDARGNPNINFEFSPESFTGTETEYALEICQDALDIWAPSKGRELILNLPATVELSSPNIFADQVEWFCTHLKRDEFTTVSVHPHNDRGTAVAATEMALLAGAQRVEGTLFGVGERSGNVDLVTLALNLFTQGIDPELDFSSIDEVIGVFEKCIRMKVPDRHPYAGKLIYTAYAGSHQDAIRKGLRRYMENASPDAAWEVPYVPMNPKDVGRTVNDLIGVSSQSGKSGYAFIIEMELGVQIPDWLARAFSIEMEREVERTDVLFTPDDVVEKFRLAYCLEGGNSSSDEERDELDDPSAAEKHLEKRLSAMSVGAKILHFASTCRKNSVDQQNNACVFVQIDRGGGDLVEIVAIADSVAACVHLVAEKSLSRCPASSKRLKCRCGLDDRAVA